MGRTNQILELSYEIRMKIDYKHAYRFYIKHVYLY